VDCGGWFWLAVICLHMWAVFVTFWAVVVMGQLWVVVGISSCVIVAVCSFIGLWSCLVEERQ